MEDPTTSPPTFTPNLEQPQPTSLKLGYSQQCTAMYITLRVLAPAYLLRYTDAEFSLSLS